MGKSGAVFVFESQTAISSMTEVSLLILFDMACRG